MTISRSSCAPGTNRYTSPMPLAHGDIWIQARYWQTESGYRGLSMQMGLQAEGGSLPETQEAMEAQIARRVREIGELPDSEQPAALQKPAPWPLRLAAWWATRSGSICLTQGRRAKHFIRKGETA